MNNVSCHTIVGIKYTFNIVFFLKVIILNVFSFLVSEVAMSAKGVANEFLIPLLRNPLLRR